MKEFRNRHKAFVGTLVAAGVSLAGTALSNMAKAKQQRELERQQNYKDNIDRIAALNNAYANQDYADDFEDRIVYKLGGRLLSNPSRRVVASQDNKSQFSNVPIFKDRYQKYKCGGRR